MWQSNALTVLATLALCGILCNPVLGATTSEATSTLSECPGLVATGSIKAYKCCYAHLSTIPSIPADVYFISLYNNEITYISENFYQVHRPDANVLELQDNAITSIPLGAFDGMPNLTEISLVRNRITFLPANVFKPLTKIQFIGLNRNSITYVPVDLFHGLTLLNYISLNSNGISEISSDMLTGLISLKYFYMTDNLLRFLPAGLFRGLSLMNDIAFDNNQLTGLPKYIFQRLTQMTQLDLSSNLIESLPEGVFGDLVGLQTLYLNNNRISRIESQCQGLSALTELNLSTNSISTLESNSFEGLTSLVLLEIEVNQLTRLFSGGFAGLVSMQTLDLADNNITSIGAGVFQTLTSLVALNLESNHIISVQKDALQIMNPNFNLYFAGNPLECSTTGCSDCIEQYKFSASALFYTCGATPTTGSLQALSTKDKVLISFAVVIVVFVVGILLHGWRNKSNQATNLRKKEHLHQRLLDETKDDLAESQELNKRMMSAYEICIEDVLVGEKVASGSFGDVYDGSYGGHRIAIKILKHPNDPESHPEVAEDFSRECETLMAIRHPHLVIFYGTGVTNGNHKFMVTEFMSLGSLRRVLADSSYVLEWPTRIDIAWQIAKGMAHLHELGIIHRDLKSDNCLLNEHMTAKVTDFGTSKLLRKSSESSGNMAVESQLHELDPKMTVGVGTLLWMAPEVLIGKSCYGPEADVYSYAIVLWELATRDTPWTTEINESQYIRFYAALVQAIENEQRPHIPANIYESREKYVTLLKLCWAQQPQARPKFQAVVMYLADIRPESAIVNTQIQ